MNTRSPNKWQELTTACQRAHSLIELDAAICKQIVADKAAFHEVPHISALHCATVEQLEDMLPDLLPGSSFCAGFTSDDHSDGEEAPRGWWASILVGWKHDKGAPEDGWTVNGRQNKDLAFAEVFCMAAGFVVEAALEKSEA